LEVFGLDLTPEMIAEAKIRTAGCNVNLAVGQLEQLPYRDKSFDVILALGVLEYLPDQSAALIEIARVAKPDAVVILSMVNKLSLYRWWERYVYGYWKRFKSHIAGHNTRQEPAMWLQSEKSLTRLMKTRQLEPIDTVYFDLNVCVAPFDLKYPRQASALNRWASMHFARWFFPVVHTGFLIRARKCA
jgi:ubiquinone/menaquinone biosynthesis C-methylase UbiE